jgi:Tol biopolymer transport system component
MPLHGTFAPMKMVLGLIVLPATLISQTPQSQTGSLPPNGAAEQVPLVEAGKRTIYLARGGELWAFDQASSTPTRLVAGRIWDVAVSAKGDLLAYVKGGEERTDHFIYLQSLDPRTDLPQGSERRLTSVQGDAPAISPDGRFIAFARDDSSGVGQSLFVVPATGGKERLVAAAMPSSIRSIAWTPDGKTIYFGVNPPVPCVPEWSCLPLAQSQRRWATIRRVSASGGAVTTVVSSAQSPSPGLSPDGSTIVYRANDGSRKWIVAEPDGSTRTTLTLTQTQVMQTWSGNATLILGESSFGRGLRSLSALDVSKKP